MGDSDMLNLGFFYSRKDGLPEGILKMALFYIRP